MRPRDGRLPVIILALLSAMLFTASESRAAKDEFGARFGGIAPAALGDPAAGAMAGSTDPTSLQNIQPAAGEDSAPDQPAPESAQPAPSSAAPEIFGPFKPF